MKPWGNLKAGDVILCPVTRRTEKVIRVALRRDGTVFVRTDRHDHYRQQDAGVEVQS
jgi:hypothetical protein